MTPVARQLGQNLPVVTAGRPTFFAAGGIVSMDAVVLKVMIVSG
jgi:hypothetical protein